MEQFILVREFFHATPMVTVYTRLQQATEAFNRELPNTGKQVTLYQSKLDSLGWDQPIELMTKVI